MAGDKDEAMNANLNISRVTTAISSAIAEIGSITTIQLLKNKSMH
jgi:hypothetical protein